MGRLLSSEVAKPSIDLTNHENSKNEMQVKLREKLDQIPQPLDTGHSEVLKVNESRTLTNSHGTVTMAKLKQGTRKLGKLTKICIWNCRSLCSEITSKILVDDFKRRQIALSALEETQLGGKTSAFYKTQ